jgi:hypothetical protein
MSGKVGWRREKVKRFSNRSGCPISPPCCKLGWVYTRPPWQGVTSLRARFVKTSQRTEVQMTASALLTESPVKAKHSVLI